MTVKFLFQYFGFTIYDLRQQLTAQLVLFPTQRHRYFPICTHIAEELWSLLGNEGSIATVPFPVLNPNI
jgi:hypothetical protein